MLTIRISEAHVFGDHFHQAECFTCDRYIVRYGDSFESVLKAAVEHVTTLHDRTVDPIYRIDAMGIGTASFRLNQKGGE